MLVHFFFFFLYSLSERYSETPPMFELFLLLKYKNVKKKKKENKKYKNGPGKKTDTDMR